MLDTIDHAVLMDRVRLRVKDKRVLLLVKAFLEAGILTELGDSKETHTGRPQGALVPTVGQHRPDGAR